MWIRIRKRSIFKLALVSGLVLTIPQAYPSGFAKGVAGRVRKGLDLLSMKGEKSAQTSLPSPSNGADPYTIGPGDVLAIHVWQEPDASTSVTVLPDGKITLPLIGDLRAGGLTPSNLQTLITTKLSQFIKGPQVTVIIQQVNSRKFNVLGEVQKPGSFPLVGTLRVMDGLALAGGFRDFAKEKKIYVLRRGSQGSVEKFPFDYKAVAKGYRTDENIILQPGDTIVVP